MPQSLALRDISDMGALHSQVIAQRLGVNSTDLECLDLIVRGPVTAGALAAATGLTTGAITGAIDRLERAGFARRDHDAQDRRKVLVRALPAVLERAAPLYEPIRRASAALLSSYRDDHLALLLDFLTRAHAGSVDVVAALRKEPAAKRERPKSAR